MSAALTASPDATSIFVRERAVTVIVDGQPQPVAVRPFRLFGDMTALRDVLPALAPFLGRLQQGQYLEALLLAGEPCLQIVAIATRQPPDFVLALEAEDQLALLTATLEVNSDFFVQRLTPAIATLVSRLIPTTPPGAAQTFQDMTSAAASAATTSTSPTPPAP